VIGSLLVATLLLAPANAGAAFDQSFAAYGRLLQRVVHDARVDDDAQLDEAGRRYLGSPYGLQVSGDNLRVTSILKWYGNDFIERFASMVPSDEPEAVRAVLGAVVRFGPTAGAALAKTGRARATFLPYDWSLNDLDRAR